MSTPRAAAVIPTFNRRGIVTDAIDSVLAQTEADFELIVVDDGSTDGTAEALRARYDDPRLRVVEQENGGTAAARNRGVDEARAPYVGFLDSDDVWMPRFLESQIACLERTGADAVLCDAEYVNVDREGASLFSDRTWRTPVGFEAMVAGGWGLPTALLVRTEVARAVGFDPAYRLSEDTEWLFRFNHAGHRLVLNEDRVACWRHASSDRKTTGADYGHILMRLRALRGYPEHAGARRWLRRTLYDLHRRLARELTRGGHWHEAGPHLAFIARMRPHRPRALLRCVRAWLARPSEPPPPEVTAQQSAGLLRWSR